MDPVWDTDQAGFYTAIRLMNYCVNPHTISFYAQFIINCIMNISKLNCATIMNQKINMRQSAQMN